MGRPANHAWLGSEWTGLPDLVVGALVGVDFTVWRVLEVGPRPADLVERGRTHAVVLEPLAGGRRLHLACAEYTRFHTFTSAHYPVCRSCGDLMPCREQIIERTVQAEAEQLRRYDLPGICPACEEPVSQRQLRQRWPENLVAPTGQPVTFHLRNRCVGEASAYDERWRKAGHISMLGIAG